MLEPAKHNDVTAVGMRARLHLEDWISAKLKLSEINEGFAAM
jgi:hypothetical protein